MHDNVPPEQLLAGGAEDDARRKKQNKLRIGFPAEPTTYTDEQKKLSGSSTVATEKTGEDIEKKRELQQHMEK